MNKNYKIFKKQYNVTLTTMLDETTISNKNAIMLKPTRNVA